MTEHYLGNQTRWNWFKLVSYGLILGVLAVIVPLLAHLTSNAPAIVEILTGIVVVLAVVFWMMFMREHPTRVILMEEEMVVDMGALAGKARLLHLRREDVAEVQEDTGYFRLAPIAITVSGRRYSWILSRGLTKTILGRLDSFAASPKRGQERTVHRR